MQRIIYREIFKRKNISCFTDFPSFKNLESLKSKIIIMKTIDVLDKTFSLSISEEEIQQAIKVVAEKINTELADKNPIFLSVLNGAFMFTADLMKNVNIPCEVAFIRLASYQFIYILGGEFFKIIELHNPLCRKTLPLVFPD